MNLRSRFLFPLFIVFLSFSLLRAEFPADITCLIVDLKYNREQGVKICEFQQVSISMFSGYDYLYEGDGLVAERLANFLGQYQLPLWFINLDISDPKVKKQFKKNGWIGADTIDEIVKNPHFLELSALPVENIHQINQYHGMLYARPRNIPSTEEFRKRYPGILLIDAPFFPYKGDKHKMSQLLTGDERLEKLKPKWNVYPKQFSEELVERIKEEIGSNILVIKPLGAAKGAGVIIIGKEELYQTLDCILMEDKNLLRRHRDNTYNYWARDPQAVFLVEEFIESDPVAAPQYNGALYDGTMRVVLGLSYNQGKTDVAFFEEHWKLPLKSLSEEGTLIEKHRSFGKQPHFAKVDSEAVEIVHDQLKEGFLLIYEKMLVSIPIN